MSFEQAERNYLQPPDGPDMDLLREKWADSLSFPGIAIALAEYLCDLKEPIRGSHRHVLANAIESALPFLDIDEVAALGASVDACLPFDEWLAEQEADEEGRRDNAAIQRAELRDER